MSIFKNYSSWHYR
ncbi:MAG TPA: hypothetical protein DCS22_10695 [Flavobacteriaceae bacterium]|nr:hypothetical protein [Flavobacteriaceae bacterium]